MELLQPVCRPGRERGPDLLYAVGLLGEDPVDFVLDVVRVFQVLDFWMTEEEFSESDHSKEDRAGKPTPHGGQDNRFKIVIVRFVM